MVLTRPVTRNDRHCFQVYRQPIPVQDLILEDLQDGDVRTGGSFRGAFSNADKGKVNDSQRQADHTFSLSFLFPFTHWNIFPPFSQEHIPGTLPGPISGPVPHTAGQWCLQQATVAQLPPHCHVDPERFAAPWERILVHPCQYWRLHQTPLVYRLCHHPYGRDGWKLSTGRGLCPFFPQFWGAPQPHTLHNLHPLLILFIVFNFRPLPAPQIQKGQAFNLLIGQEKGDHGVKTKLSQGAHGVELCGGLVFMCVWTVCFHSSVFVTVHNGSYYYQIPPPMTLPGPCGPHQYQKDSIREATVWISRDWRYTAHFKSPRWFVWNRKITHLVFFLLLVWSYFWFYFINIFFSKFYFCKTSIRYLL